MIIFDVFLTIFNLIWNMFAIFLAGALIMALIGGIASYLFLPLCWLIGIFWSPPDEFDDLDEVVLDYEIKKESETIFERILELIREINNFQKFRNYEDSYANIFRILYFFLLLPTAGFALIILALSGTSIYLSTLSTIFF